ncbi:MAG: HU family DNA-binding protein [Endomicrobium sp.]|jgi:nucleoid DNA-binding protein|nr:HU family DNA-binding protein [Endomicrobium sp.]
MQQLIDILIEIYYKMNGFLKSIVHFGKGINLMKKTDIVKQIANVSGLTQGDSNKAIKALVKVIQNTIKNGEVISFSGLGSFRVKSRKARRGRNPKTGEIIPIPAGKKVSFKPTTTLRKLIYK